MKLSVFGTGYLGATHAAAMASLGHEVIGVDVDADKVAMLRDGTVPFFEPGLEALLREQLSTGRLRFSTDAAEATDGVDAHFIAVGTPQRAGEFAADTRYVDEVIDTLVPRLTGDTIVFGKSTVPVGTAARLRERANALRPELDVDIAWNPEFLREGKAIEDTLRPDRLVLGVGPGSRAEPAAREIYAQLLTDGVPLLVTDLPTAELVKVSANAFLATKISFINAISEVCETVGADVAVLADAIGYDARIGRRGLGAGLGFGGGCLPKDIRAFIARAGELGTNDVLTLLRDVDDINMRRRSRMVELVRQVLGVGSLVGTRVAVLGAAFKADSDDVRDSPALNVAGQLQLQGASVSVYDPQAMPNSRKLFPTLRYAESTADAATGADVVLVATEWTQFRELDPAELNGLVRGRVVIDGRNCLDPDRWRSAGWNYRGYGRP